MLKKLKFNIQGMTCVVCSGSCQKAIAKLDGVKSCNVNFASGVALVEYDEEKVGEKEIYGAVEKAGYKAIAGEKQEKKSGVAKVVAMLVFSVALLAYAMLAMAGVKYPSAISPDESPIVFTLIQLLLCIPVMIMGGAFYIRGFKNLFRAKPNMDSLVAVSTTTAFIYSFVNFILICAGDGHKVHSLYLESVAVIIAVITLGKFLESKSLKKTGDAIRQLTLLTPAYATVLRDGEWVKVDSSEVKVGDIALVKAGESFCCDGEVIEGESNVNESMLTGESMPVDKGVGSKVFGGTVNGNGILKFRAEGVGETTKLSKIIKLVEDAQNSKAPIARIADKVSGVFVPVVIAIALIAGIIWWATNGIALAVEIFVGVLVIACPCALGLATPTAIITGIGRGARGGILFKNAESLERLGSVDTVVFDKTGTVTEGAPTLTDKYLLGDEEEILSLVRAVESVSEHPIAKAITEALPDNGIKAEVKILSGYGLEGKADGKTVLCGNKALMDNYGVNVENIIEKADGFSDEGKSIIMIAIDGRAVGVLAVADTLKDDSAQAIERLKKLNLRLILLSGDNKRVADNIASKAGIDEVIANVLPEQKSEVIERLMAEGRNVAMVGDGINDAPALAKANVGIAMGSGSDIAIESGQVVIVGGKISGVERAIRLARATMRNIKENLFWAFIYNIIGIPIACGVLYPINGYIMKPMLGGLAMSLSSVSVVANALRLNMFKFDKNKKESKNECVGSCPISSADDDGKKENETMKITVNGMMCSHCESRVNKAVGELSGVTFVGADHDNNLVEVTFDGNKVTLDEIKNAIRAQGYEVL
jgi:Cu+-exporting ATPase